MPMLSTTKFSTYMKLEEIDATFYKTIVGKLIFLTNIRLDITFVLGLSIDEWLDHRNPTLKQHIFKYIKATTNFGIFYHHERDGAINDFTDTNWAGDKDQ
jgi:hypothetical protein